MKKTFPLQVEGKNPDRLLDATKNEIRKYIKRERRRELPAGADYWDFDCRFGPAEAAAQPAHLSALIGLVDGVAKEGGSQFYIEILAKPAQRKARPAETAGAVDEL
ncbi:MAG: DUF6172 family protein [Pseudomonadota bacterium]|nr:DUF6172 family protein [Pseudomonadota bacterium]